MTTLENTDRTAEATAIGEAFTSLGARMIAQRLPRPLSVSVQRYYTPDNGTPPALHFEILLRADDHPIWSAALKSTDRTQTYACAGQRLQITERTDVFGVPAILLSLVGTTS